MMPDVTRMASTDYLIKGLQEQRKDGTLTDITLYKGSQEFKAHKTVLAAASQYFKAMSGRRFKEQNVGSVRLDDTQVTTAGLEIILDAIFCAKLHLTTITILEVTTAVDFLQLPSFRPMCEQFLIENVSTET